MKIVSPTSFMLFGAFLDILTTIIILSTGGYELNPFFSDLKLGYIIVLKIMVVLVIYVLFSFIPKYAKYPFIIIGIVYSFVSISNIYNILLHFWGV